MNPEDNNGYDPSKADISPGTESKLDFMQKRGMVARLFGWGKKQSQELPKQPIQPAVPEPSANVENELNEKAQDFEQKFRQATHIEPTSLPTGEGQEALIQKLVTSVRARGYFGKFPDQTTINGVALGHTKDEDFSYYGDQGVFKGMGSWRGNPFETPFRIIHGVLRERLTSNEGQRYQEIRASNLVAATNKPDGVNTVINYLLDTSYTDRAGRPGGQVRFGFEMPKEQAAQLLALIRTNPDSAEAFLHQAARGFDDPGGIQRTTSRSVTILNLDQLDPAKLDPYKDPRTGQLRKDMPLEGNLIVESRNYIKSSLTTNSSLAETYNYSNITKTN